MCGIGGRQRDGSPRTKRNEQFGTKRGRRNVRCRKPDSWRGRADSRNTYEGLMDLASSCYTDGPKAVMMFDELSLCVSGCGNKIPGIIWSAAQFCREKGRWVREWRGAGKQDVQDTFGFVLGRGGGGGGGKEEGVEF